MQKKQKQNALCATLNIRDTSTKHTISGQSAPIVKDCMAIMFDMVDTDKLLKNIDSLLLFHFVSGKKSGA